MAKDQRTLFLPTTSRTKDVFLMSSQAETLKQCWSGHRKALGQSTPETVRLQYEEALFIIQACCTENLT